MKSEEHIKYAIKDIKGKSIEEMLELCRPTIDEFKLLPAEEIVLAAVMKGAMTGVLKSIIKDGEPRYSVAELKKIADKFYPNINYEFFEVLENKKRVEAILNE